MYGGGEVAGLTVPRYSPTFMWVTHDMQKHPCPTGLLPRDERRRDQQIRIGIRLRYELLGAPELVV